MLHSGALYVRQHGHVVRHCQQAHAAFQSLLSCAEIPVNRAIYIVRTDEMDEFRAGLDRHGISHRGAGFEDVPEVDPRLRSAHQLLEVSERVFSSRRIIAILAGQCLAAGVTIQTGTAVDTIAHQSGNVRGVVLGSGHVLRARHVVIAAGTGTTELLTRLESRQAGLLRSRLDMMIHIPDAGMNRGLIFASLHQPVMMPALDGGMLTSFFGGVQPQIAGRRAYSVDLGKANALLQATVRALAPARIDPLGAVAYVAGKTDYVGSAHAENGAVNPGYHVIDHTDADGIAGLYTVITGKMTLGFHVSKSVADTILGAEQPLVPQSHPATDPPATLLAVEPWAPPARL